MASSGLPGSPLGARNRLSSDDNGISPAFATNGRSASDHPPHLAYPLPESPPELEATPGSQPSEPAPIEGSPAEDLSLEPVAPTTRSPADTPATTAEAAITPSPAKAGKKRTRDHGFLPVLKNLNFLALWSGQVFSQLADKVYLVLMIALIDTHFQAADQTISGWVSSIMIAFTIPAVLFGSIAGVYVDRWPKKLVLVTTNLIRGALVLSLPFLLWISKGWSPLSGLPLGFCLLLVITFLVSTLTQFFAPAEQTAIPLLVAKRHLLPANSLYTTTMMASVIVGFAVGEPLLAIADHLMSQIFHGPEIGKEILVGSGYVIAGLLLLLIRPHEKIDPVEFESIHVGQDIRDGLQYLREHTRVRNALIQLVILFSIFAALAVLAVRLAELIPGMKPSQFGFLLAAGGVGTGCGAAIVGYFGKRLGTHTQLSLYGSLGVAAALVGLSLFSLKLWIVLPLLAVLGGFSALVGVPMQTTIQAETPEEMRGKVFGLQNNAINIALTLPLALAGVAETFLGLQTVFMGLAVISIAGGLLTWYISGK
ncbi:MFS transporter [Leptolyngbya sp. 'hensonii']|uniref:MFS transporter n=1 Tax=Leptolyngbya sp. 'hensonii' TaxID=1922337 RepID=UPI001C0E487A|nr:MFS transporter [Leptolyngbya sp. 'hensonii']